MPASVLVVQRPVNRRLLDFPATVDLSSPESAAAAYQRASARLDAAALRDLAWSPAAADSVAMRFLDDQTAAQPEATILYTRALAEGLIVEVLSWGEDLAAVVTRLPLPPGMDAQPYTVLFMGRLNGLWKAMGEDRLPTQEQARTAFEVRKEALWQEHQDLTEQTAPAAEAPEEP